MIVIVSSSLSSDSKSRVLAQEAKRVLEQDGVPVALFDLRDHPLPLCDAGPAYEHPNVAQATDLLASASGIILATPIYNYDGAAAAKNLIELTGRAWENKTVGLLCAAAGMSSYMAIMSFANSLMLDFRSVIVPRFVYATGRDFDGDVIRSEEVKRRVAELARATARMSSLLKAA